MLNEVCSWVKDGPRMMSYQLVEYFKIAPKDCKYSLKFFYNEFSICVHYLVYRYLKLKASLVESNNVICLPIRQLSFKVQMLCIGAFVTEWSRKFDSIKDVLNTFVALALTKKRLRLWLAVDILPYQYALNLIIGTNRTLNH